MLYLGATENGVVKDSNVEYREGINGNIVGVRGK